MFCCHVEVVYTKCRSKFCSNYKKFSSDSQQEVTPATSKSTLHVGLNDPVENNYAESNSPVSDYTDDRIKSSNNNDDETPLLISIFRDLIGYELTHACAALATVHDG